MPVVTRSQVANVVSANKTQVKPSRAQLKIKFMERSKQYLHDELIRYDLSNNLDAQIAIITFKCINSSLFKNIQAAQPHEWVNLILTVFDKSIEFEEYIVNGGYSYKLNALLSELRKSKKHAIEFIKGYKENMAQPLVYTSRITLSQARDMIRRLEHDNTPTQSVSRNFLETMKRHIDNVVSISDMIYLFKYINNNLFNNLRAFMQEKWLVNLILVVFNKAIEFENYITSKRNKFSKSSSQMLMRELAIAKKHAAKFIKEYNDNDMSRNYTGLTLSKAKEIIALEWQCASCPSRSSTRRSTRKVKRVDYTYMDSIEPYNEYDVITDIWFDNTYYYDSDYVFEEDYDDDEM